MLLNFLEDAAKNLASRVIPPATRYFTYIFIVVGILWLGGANYYYFAEDCAKFKGCLITGLIFLAASAATAVWENYQRKNEPVKQAGNSNELIVKALPLVLPVVIKIFTRIFLRPQTLKALGVIGLLGSGLYWMLRSKKNRQSY